MAPSSCALALVLLAAVAALGTAASIPAPQPTSVLVALRHTDAAAAQVERLLDAVSDPASAQYGRFKTVDELAAVVGREEGEVEAVVSWLSSLGLGNIRVQGLRDAVTADFPGGVSALPRTPHHLRDVVHFIVLRTAEQALRERGRTTPTLSAAPGDGIDRSPTGQREAYGVPADLRGSNTSNSQMVWGPGTFGFAMSNLQEFRSKYGIAGDPNIHYDTDNHGKAGGDNFGEGSLDTEYITGMGNGVYTVVSNTNTSSSTEEGLGFGAALLDFATLLPSRKPPQVLPKVLSMSLGSLSSHSCKLLCEKIQPAIPLADCKAFMQQQRQVCMYISDDQTDRINTAFRLASLQGTTLLAATGDGGSHFSFEKFPAGKIGDALNKVSCEYNFPTFPASSPVVLGVGGVEWDTFKGPSKPVGWSGSGGGFSWLYARPSYQDGAVEGYLKSTSGLPPASSYNGSNRGYPDVSALAIGTPMCDGGCFSAGGTSASTPSFAGLVSLINDHRLNSGLPPLGLLNPRLYAEAATHAAEMFTDVTSGNTKTSCSTGFPATAGWDPMTGWGQPKWAGLLKYLGSDAHLEPRQASQ